MFPELGNIPLINLAVFAYVDGGGTYTRVTLFEGQENVFQHTYTSEEWTSLYAILGDAFRQAGVTPLRIAFALAGPANLEAGTVRLSNRDRWPTFDIGPLHKHTGCFGGLFNDMELAAADAIRTPADKLEVIRPGYVYPAGRVLIFTHSTGVGGALEENGVTTRMEPGNDDVTPLSPSERGFLEYVAKTTGKPFAIVEHVLSGGHGYPHAIAWMRCRGYKPNATTQAMIDGLAAKGEGPGPAIDQNVHVDAFAARIVDVMGGLLGTWLRKQMGIHQPSGGVQLIGGMGKGTALYADPKLSPFMERLHMGLRHAELVDTYQIAVNRDETLHDRGGRILAERVGR